jgi:hypothetical protein
MRVFDMSRERFIESSDVAGVMLLLTLTLCIGLYLIVTTAVIAKDGIFYIDYAKQIATAPLTGMRNQGEHPGYSWLILAAHKLTDFLSKSTSVLRWVYCGQGVSLIFRLLAVAVLCFIAKQLIGARQSFWAVLILVLLPRPAEYGSDVLNTWPHLFFLVAGFLTLITAAKNNKWWMFGVVGLIAGAGYLIRPECAQLVVFGGLWLVLQLLRTKDTSDRIMVLYALVMLFVGYIIVAGPYVILKGTVFPEKSISISQIPLFTPSHVGGSFGRMVTATGEALMWFFLPPMLIGVLKSIKVRKWYEPGTFFVVAIICLNLAVMMWLYCCYGYITDRHMLPMLIIPVLYVPVGLREMARYLSEKLSGKTGLFAAMNLSERTWLLVLTVVGIAVCIPKLLIPIRIEKQNYRAAAEWLKVNTNSADTVAVPDERISFYAEREAQVYGKGSVPAETKYIVIVSKNGNDKTLPEDRLGKVVYERAGEKKGRGGVIIYKRS